MVLGSHNTMTYLKPRKWWMWLGRFMAKCQSKTIQEQYDAGARWFDLRIVMKPKKSHCFDIYFAHGITEFKGDIHEVLRFLNGKDDAFCRIILERGDNIEAFKEFAKLTMVVYSNLKVTQIAKKGDWGSITTPNAIYYPMKDAYASSNTYNEKWKNAKGILKNKMVSGLLIDDLCPWIYAKLHNKKNIKKHKDENICLLIDFV